MLCCIFLGKDATVDFEDVGHSNDAQEIMKKFCIGEVDESTLPSTARYTPPPVASATVNREAGDSTKVVLYLVPLLILGVAFLLRLYNKDK